MVELGSEQELLVGPLIMSVGLAFGYYFHVILTRIGSASDTKKATRILEDARQEADSLRREAKVSARDEVVRARENFEKETLERRKHLTLLDERLSERELNIDRRLSLLEKKEAQADARQHALEQREQELVAHRKELDDLIGQERTRLQEMAQMTVDEARKLLLRSLEQDVQTETGNLIRRKQEEAAEAADLKAREVIVAAIERYAGEVVGEVTSTVVVLPSEEMKGRIIGREGRNIRVLEQEFGCNVLVDETPKTVIISGYDPLRREIARRALELLIADGRIQPARIEEITAKVRDDMESLVRQAGEKAIYELGLTGVAPELVRTVGRLKFRHSYSQNVLQHAVEMAHLMGMMAADEGLDQQIARRVGLFHDLGKALDHSVEGGHAIIGADLLKKHGESPLVYNAVAAHHHEAEGMSPYAALASAADAITAARPGARADTTDLYLKRLNKLETIAGGYRGVKTAYAIQAGREVRVMVTPEKVNDSEAAQLARNIAKQISEEVKFPGQIRVTVIRETRCLEYAR